MFRSHAKRVLALAVTGSVALGASPALASQIQDTLLGSSSTTRQETRLVPTNQTEEVPGAREFMGTTPQVTEKITGAASKLVTESEIRHYRIPVTTHSLSREEKRDITTTTKQYKRRTTTTVTLETWPVWVYYRGHSWKGDSVNAIPFHVEPSRYADGRNRPPTPVMSEGIRKEFTAEQQKNDKTIFVEIIPHDASYIHLRMAFDRNLKYVAGYFNDNARHGDSEIKFAQVTNRGGYHEIEVHADCNKHGNFFVNCGTNLRRKFQLHGFVVHTENRARTEDVVKEENYQTVSDSAGPWTPTGRMIRGAALTNPGLRYDSVNETVVLRQYHAMNEAVSPKKLASSANDVRKTFSADKSSGKDRAALSGSKVRQSLGANRVTPSRVADNKGAGVPSVGGGTVGSAGNGQPAQGRAPSTAPPAAPPAAPSAVPSPAPSAPPSIASGPAPNPPQNTVVSSLPQPQATPTPHPVSNPLLWWFPVNPLTPPAVVRYESYIQGQ